MYLGLWAVGAIHSTATLSPEGPCGLYGLRLVHRLNISLFCFGPRAGQAIFFWPRVCPNPNPILMYCNQSDSINNIHVLNISSSACNATCVQSSCIMYHVLDKNLSLLCSLCSISRFRAALCCCLLESWYAMLQWCSRTC